MPLILAIEPDHRQAAQLKIAVRRRLRADLVLADTAEAALAALGDRVPDLVLTSAFLSPRDETALAERLRALDTAAAHVQTLTIPVLDVPREPASVARGMLSVLLRDRVSTQAAPDGCDPAVFADQCAAYLEHTANERVTQIADVEDSVIEEPAFEPQVIEVAAPVMEWDNRPPEHHVPDGPPEGGRHVRVPDGPPEGGRHVRVPDDPPEAGRYAPVPDGPPEGERDVPMMEPVVEAAPAQTMRLPDHLARQAGFEIELSSMLDEAVVHELSAAIESVTASDPNRWVQPRPTKRADKWTAIPIGNKTLWPQMEGKASETRTVADSAGKQRREPPNQRPKRRSSGKPVKDAWGLFDPAQCGFAALLAKLDEITDVASPLPTVSPSADSLDVSR
jgi:hypothetical protein